MYLCNLNVKGFHQAGMHLCERKGEHEYDLKTLMQYNQHHMDMQTFCRG